jgi:hypothetical protein
MMTANTSVSQSACRFSNDRLQRIVVTGGHKKALLFQIHAHVIEAPFNPRQRYRLHQPERQFFLGGCRDSETEETSSWISCPRYGDFLS